MEIVAKFKGLDELEKMLKTLPDEVQRKALTAALMQGAEVIRKDARSRIPVRQESGAKKLAKKGKGRLPGFLRASIVKRRNRKTDASATVSVGWTKQAFYGLFLEFGTRFVPARPFLRPAMDAKAGEAAKKFGEVLGPQIIKIAQRIARKRGK